MHIAIVPLIVGLVLVGLSLWALSQFPAIDATIKKIVWVLLIVVAVLWVMQCCGLLHFGVSAY